MTSEKRPGQTKDQLIDKTLELIAERGSSKGISLREISRQVGCAHTNIYNYFSGMDELFWAAFRKSLRIYADYLTRDLDRKAGGKLFFNRLVSNMVNFAVTCPGLHRFISSDPLIKVQIPEDILAAVKRMKIYFIQIIHILAQSEISMKEADRIGSIILSYLDGEILNAINGRILDDEKIPERITGNAAELFTLLTAKKHDGIDPELSVKAGTQVFPELVLYEL